ncbi:hypothetical protein [Maritimibacter sp. DP1N21-5]|uniref:hypothetical protein n=1 Tax=Maritimibacter sp. DP1N21-5 TaxID=2836867 RepID=UPI001C44CB15|nr:hypothetical protein [Maritimibacter sp. DP1N21-5]MBV7409681.1 hypothetical protein [Maritimibacter sp. DP1N21-5]
MAHVDAALMGKVRDETGDLLTPTHTKRRGRRLRYYISNRLVSGGPDKTGWRLPAKAFEEAVAQAISDHLKAAAARHAGLMAGSIADTKAATDRIVSIAQAIETEGILRIAKAIHSVTLTRRSMTIGLNRDAVASDLEMPAEILTDELLTFETAVTLKRRGIEMKLVAGDRTPEPDRTLLRALRHAHRWADLQKSGISLTDIAKRDGVSQSYVRRITPLATLSPSLQRAIVTGRQPIDLTLETLVRRQLPIRFEDQERMFRLT